MNIKVKKINLENIEKILFYSIIFWPIIFVINEVIKFPTVLLTLISLFIMLLYLIKYNKRKFLIIIALVGISIITQFIMVSYGATFGSRNIVYMAEWVKFTIRWTHLILILFVFSDKYVMDKLKYYCDSTKNYIFNTGIIIILVELISLLINSSYENVWEGRYFKSIFYNPHVNSYFLILPMFSFVYCYFKLENQWKRYISLGAIFIILMLNLMTGARTTTIIAIAMVGVIIISEVIKDKKLIWYGLMIIVLLLLINWIFKIVDFKEIPLIKKTIEVFNNPSGLLNGRNYIWNNMIQYFNGYFGFSNYIFGIGLSQSMRINEAFISQSLWAHNDLIETLIGGGIFSFITYLYAFVVFFRNNKSILLGEFIFLILFFNGLFVYSELVTYIPFITIAFFIGTLNLRENIGKLYSKRSSK